ncbi:alpha/beta fold hydrolase [Rhodococcus hoagii]|nr:alpha/beta fold hydrolase [Prescottella equi]
MPDTPDTPHLAVDAPPVMFIHGLWLAASSWDPWRTRFGAAGFSTLAPTWPGEAPSITDTREHADDQAGYGIDEVTAHFAEAIAPLGRKPIVVGHSFGGLVAQKLLAADVAAAAVAIDPAQIQGVKVLPLAQLRSTFSVLGNPANAKRTVTLTPDAFAYSFGNAIDRSESDEIYDHWTIPSPGRPLFQAAFANLLPGFSRARRHDRTSWTAAHPRWWSGPRRPGIGQPVRPPPTATARPPPTTTTSCWRTAVTPSPSTTVGRTSPTPSWTGSHREDSAHPSATEGPVSPRWRCPPRSRRAGGTPG